MVRRWPLVLCRVGLHRWRTVAVYYVQPPRFLERCVNFSRCDGMRGRVG